MTNIMEWLKQEPEIEDLIEVEAGVFTHRYESIVNKLYMLCPYGWDTVNFQHQYFTMPDGSVKVSGSVEVVVEYIISNTVTEAGERIGLRSPSPKNIKRILSGAATFSTTDYSNEHQKNEHFAATVKSLAIVNAVKVLGRQFGWGLNEGDSLPVQNIGKKKTRSVVKLDPDEHIWKMFDNAIEEKNLTKINMLLRLYNINLEGTDYATQIANIQDTNS